MEPAEETTPLCVPRNVVRAAPTPSLSRAREVLIIATLGCAGLLNIFTIQSIVIVLPSVGRALSIPVSRQQMVVSIYATSSGCFLLLWGRLADIYGRKRVFLTGAIIFCLSTFIAPFAPDEVSFYICRSLQGCCSAATVPSAFGLLASIFPSGPGRSRAFVAYTTASAVGAVLGNLAGGFIGSYFSWKWIFWVSSFMGALVAAAGYTFVPSDRRETCPLDGNESSRYVDWTGGFLISTGLALLLIVVSQANVLGWDNFLIPGLMVLSAMLVLSFILWQKKMERNPECHPLVKISLFKNPRFSAAFVIIGCFFGSFSSFLVFASFFYQDYVGLDVLETTVRFLPAGIVGVLACFVLAPTMSVVRHFHLLLFGLSCSIISPLLFAFPTITQLTSYWVSGFPAMCLCLSADVVWPVVALFVSRSVPEEDQSLAGGLLQTANLVGRSLGLVIATAVQSVVHGQYNTGSPSVKDPLVLAGLRAAQWTNAGLAGIALTIALLFFGDLDEA